MYDLSTPPAPFSLFVYGRHGSSKFRVRIGKLNKIADAETVLRWAKERRAAGGEVHLNGYVHDPDAMPVGLYQIRY